MQLEQLPYPNLTEKLMATQADAVAAAQGSSHWREMHRDTVARVAGRNSTLELTGRGFGNMQQHHPAQIPLEWMTSLSHWLISQGRLNLTEAAVVLRKLFRRIPAELRPKRTFDAVRQVFAWQTIRPFLPARRPLTWCVIGDGFGVFSALIKEFQPDATVFLVDLPKTLVFQSVYVQMMHPKSSHSLYEEQIDSDFVYCPVPQLPESRGGIDVFVNVNSMQEMTGEAVRGYFEFFRRTGRRDNLFYCSNRVEKRLPDGEVMRFQDYPWKSGDKILIDESCPYQRFFFHLRTLQKGPRFLGARIPFINFFDGDHWHRLARLETRNQEG
jgi:hypothetical protein